MPLGNDEAIMCGCCGSYATIRINSSEMKCRHCQRIIAWEMVLTCHTFAKGSATLEGRVPRCGDKAKVRTAAQMAEERSAANKRVLREIHKGGK